MGRDLNLGLYDLGLRGPTLVFSDAGMAARVEQLRDRGFAFASRLPRGLTGSDAALLQTPDGPEILLLVASQDPGPPDSAGLRDRGNAFRLGLFVRLLRGSNHEADLQHVGHLDRSTGHAVRRQAEFCLAQVERTAGRDSIRAHFDLRWHLDLRLPVFQRHAEPDHRIRPRARCARRTQQDDRISAAIEHLRSQHVLAGPLARRVRDWRGKLRSGSRSGSSQIDPQLLDG